MIIEGRYLETPFSAKNTTLSNAEETGNNSKSIHRAIPLRPFEKLLGDLNSDGGTQILGVTERRRSVVYTSTPKWFPVFVMLHICWCTQLDLSIASGIGLYNAYIYEVWLKIWLKSSSILHLKQSSDDF